MKKLAFLSIIILTGCTNSFSAQNTTTLAPADQNQEMTDVHSPEKVENIPEIAQEEKTLYACADGNKFTLSHRAYISGDAIIALTNDQFFLFDEQTSVSHIVTEDSQNPEYYSDDTIALVFETPIHHEASVLQGDSNLYVDCIPISPTALEESITN